MINYVSWIGQQVRKKKKPFKSGSLVNTIKGIVDHPYVEGKKAFIFVEDESAVSCEKCYLVTKKNI